MSPQKFEKVVNKICKVANTCKIKKGILQKALGSIPKEQPNSPPYSLLQLQSFKNQNCITDHANLVKKLKNIHGSLRKASIACNINWKTFHRLCKPPMKKVKQVRQTWTDIRTFYTKETVSQELPNVRTSG